MTTLDFIRRIEQQQKEQDHIYHNTAVRYGLSDTDMWILYSVYTAPGTVTQQELCRQCFFPKQTVNTAIARFCKNGYASLEAIPGTRNQKKILLTDKGTELAGLYPVVRHPAASRTEKGDREDRRARPGLRHRRAERGRYSARVCAVQHFCLRGYRREDPPLRRARRRTRS